MSRPRPRTIALGTLALLLAATPFVPRGDGDQGALQPSGDQERQPALATADTAPLGAVTPDLRNEIDKVLAAGTRSGRVAVSSDPGQLVSTLVRCADFEGQRYCLHTGWTERSQAQVRAEVSRAARAVAARRAPAQSTGDLDELAMLHRYGRMSTTARIAAERAELTEAARSVAKVWLLRHEIEGVDIPAQVLEEHPEMLASTNDGQTAAEPVQAARSRSSSPTATASPTRTKSATPSPSPTRTRSASASPSPTPSPSSSPAKTKRKGWRDYPQHDAILDPADVSEQHQTYWCGPTTMQMIAWGWKGSARSQDLWAHRLGTTTSGTAISDMVRVTNHYTGWDNAKHAGAYIVLDIGNYSYAKWQLLIMRHITDYHAPVILHPILLKKYYPYLDDDASGHFQAGRGYKRQGSKPNLLGYFEPWNQQRFDPSEPYIARVQWRQAYKSYRANEAHFQHNIGV